MMVSTGPPIEFLPASAAPEHAPTFGRRPASADEIDVTGYARVVDGERIVRATRPAFGDDGSDRQEHHRVASALGTCPVGDYQVPKLLPKLVHDDRPVRRDAREAGVRGGAGSG
jgi:hypothetical protein